MTLHWKEYARLKPCRNWPFRNWLYDTVVLKDKVYIYFKDFNAVRCAPITGSLNADLQEWPELTPPREDVCYSTLTTYQSQLVLVGGTHSRELREDTNELWVSADGNNWHQSLPPMLNCRCAPIVISCASPECLIVADNDDDCCYRQSMEVFAGKKWMSVSVPNQWRYSDGIIHHGSLYLYDLESPRLKSRGDRCHYCSVESVLTSCTGNGQVPWKTIELQLDLHKDIILFSFQQHLLALTYVRDKTTISIYSTYTKSWVVEDSPNHEIFKYFFAACADKTDHILVSGFRGICEATVKGIINSCMQYICLVNIISMQCFHMILTVSSARVLSLNWRQQESLC